MLSCFGPEDRDSTEIYKIPRFPGVSWLSGARISYNIPEPIELFLDPKHPGVILPMYYKGVLVLSEEILGVLSDVGVSNLELFSASLDDPFNNCVHNNYKVVNIVGAVSAADLVKSNYTAYGELLYDVDFDSLVINESKAKGALMFRLAENLTGIVIHECVKSALENSKIPFLDFITPEEWLG
jgi:hypothetical protein